ESVAKKLKVKLSVFKNFGTASLKYHDLEIEFVGARKESYRLDSRKPIVENGTLEDDQKRRDFTINALAISLRPGSFGELLDPFNGIGDLGKKLIRTPLDPSETFSDDPLRMMRAIRFATQLNFNIDERAIAAIKSNTGRISIVSQERITDELNKIILSPKPSIGFNYLFDTGLLHKIFPQMTALYGVEIIDGKGHRIIFIIPCRYWTTFVKPRMIFGCAGQQYCMTLPSRRLNGLNRAMAGHFTATKIAGPAWCQNCLAS